MNIYQGLMKTAVRIKRILRGNSAQTGYTKYLEKIQYKQPEELKALQAVSLCELMKHAVENIPRYKYLKEQLVLTPDKAYEDIKKFPVTTKSDLLNNRDEFIDSNTPAIKEILSSGTFGKRTKALMDKYFTDHAVDEYFNKVIEIVPGKTRFIIHYIPREIEDSIKLDSDFIHKTMSGVYLMDYLIMNEEKFEIAIDILQKKKPDIIWGIVYGIYVLSKHIIDRDIKIKSPQLILCGGGSLLPRYRNTIEKAFGAKLYDRYGAAETGNLANQCKIRKGYHYIPTVHYIEILDDEMKPVGEDETGVIYITTLTKRAMPMIRYRIGDLAKHTEKPCSCGCNFPMIKSIYGREREGIISPNGNYLSPYPLELVLGKYGRMSEFQVIQSDSTSLVLRIVCKKERFSKEEELEILEAINSRLQYEMKISIRYTDEIKALSNGKIVQVISLDRYQEMGDYINEAL